MKFYNLRVSEDIYYEDGVEHTISLREGEVSLEELKAYSDIFLNKVNYSYLCLEHIDIENNIIYFYSDII